MNKGFLNFAMVLLVVSLLFLALNNFFNETRTSQTTVKILEKECEMVDNKWELMDPTNLGEAALKARGRLIGENCEEIWQKWLETTKDNSSREPPKEIPEELWNEYTLFGRIVVSDYYFNEKSVATARVWHDFEEQLYNLTIEDVWGRSTYGAATTKPVYIAMSDYEDHFRGKKGAVIGSQRPWAEIYAMRHGAASVLTVEYQETKIKSVQNWSWIHPFELARDWKKYQGQFDFVVSFSSIEHSGLGRYGDPLDPWGDLREVAKIHCLLKEQGLLILGLPIGDDMLAWNAHRIFGSIRLPWLLEGYKLLAAYWDTGANVTMTRGIPWKAIDGRNGRGSFDQPAMVLQKV